MQPELDFPGFQWLRSCRSIEYDHSKALVLSHQQVQPISPSTHPSSCPGIPFQTSVSPPYSLPCSVPRKQAKPPSSLPPTRILISPAERCVSGQQALRSQGRRWGKSINLLLTPPVSIFLWHQKLARSVDLCRADRADQQDESPFLKEERNGVRFPG